MTILLTGFEPFEGGSVNASWEAVRLATPLPGVVTVKLPVTFGGSGDLIAEAIARHRPDAVLMVGQAGNRTEVCLERVAINLDDARVADNAGDRPEDRSIDADGPAAYFAGLPVKPIVAALIAAGIPARVSDTAGTYVCNHVFYRACRLADLSGGAFRAGFIHLPPTPAQAAARPGSPSMATETAAAALRLVVEFLAGEAEARIALSLHRG